MLSIGDNVVLPQGQTGILRWTGRIKGKPIEYAGVELTGAHVSSGKHSGAYQGHKYFDTTVPNSGIFVSYSQLVSANIQTPLSKLGLGSRVPSLSDVASPSPSRGSVIGTSPRARRPQSRLSRLGAAPSIMEDPNSGRSSRVEDQGQIQFLRQQLDEKDARIKQLKQSMEEKHVEFRTTLKALEDDRDSMADNYERHIKEIQDGSVSGSKMPSELAELEAQKTALASMQNQLLQDNDDMRQRLEQAQADADKYREEAAKLKSNGKDDDFDSLLADFTAQEERLQSLHQSLADQDVLRNNLKVLRARNSELETQAAEFEGKIAEIDSLRAQLVELESVSQAPNSDETEHQKELNLLRAANKELKTKNTELESSVKALKAENDDLLELKTINAELNARVADLEHKTSDFTAQDAKHQATSRDLESKIASLSELQIKLDQADDRYATLHAQHDEVNKSYNSLKLQHSQQADKIKTLESQPKTAEVKPEDLEHLETLLSEYTSRVVELEEENRVLKEGISPVTVIEPVQDESIEYVSSPVKVAQIKPDTLAGHDTTEIPKVITPPPPAPHIDFGESSDQSALETPPLLNQPPLPTSVGATAAKAIDPAAGRPNWCGLCEKFGHTAVQCPYDD